MVKTYINNNVLVLLLAGAAILTGCSNDFDFDEARRENPEFAFKESFEKAFGAIDPDQCWDFTHNHNITRAANLSESPAAPNGLNNKWSTEWTLVDRKLIESLGEVMIEGVKNQNMDGNRGNYDNRSKGVPFVCTVPNNAFSITPVFQGGNGTSNNTLHMVVTNNAGDTKDYLIWSKGDHLQVNKGTLCTHCNGTGEVSATDENCEKCHGAGTITTTTESNCPSCNGTGYHQGWFILNYYYGCEGCGGSGFALRENGITKGSGKNVDTTISECPDCKGKTKACEYCNHGFTEDRWVDVRTNDNTYGTTYSNSYVKRGNYYYAKTYEGVRAQSLIIDKDLLPVGYTIYFYTTATSGSENLTHSSLASGGEKPEIIKLEEEGKGSSGYHIVHPTYGVGSNSEHEIMVISCEIGGDHDCNDGVFLIEGYPKVPQPLEIIDDEFPSKTSVTKRYMVEDLGATEQSDIDFNDLVVDIEDVLETKVRKEIVNGLEKKSGITEFKAKQVYTIKALGGTKDIALYVGNATSNKLIFHKNDETGANLNGSYRESDIVTGTLSKLTTEYMYNTGYYVDAPKYTDYIARVEITDDHSTSSTNGSLYNVTWKSDNINNKTVNVVNTYTRKADSWNPANNNVYVVVFDKVQKTSQLLTNFNPANTNNIVTDGVKVLTFPINGTVPTMIAVPNDQKWNTERVSVFPKSGDKFVPGTNGCELNFEDLTK